MRIGVFTDQFYPYISGVVTSIKMLYEGLTDLGHEVFVFSSLDEKKVAACEELKQFNFINIPGKPWPFKGLKDYRRTKHPKRYLKLIASYNLDVIHIHTEYNAAKLARMASKKLNIPIVYTLHTLYEDYMKYLSPFFDKHFHNIMFKVLAKKFMGATSKAATIKIVPTKKVYKLASKYYITGDIRIVPTGIQLDRFYETNITEDERLELKEKLGISPKQFVFGYIGRTSPEKGIPIIIHAFSRLKNNENAVLLIVGGGPQLEELKEYAKVLNVDNKVIFTDFIDNNLVPMYYHICDIFVNASRSETQGLTYIESLASSLPLLVQKDECIEDVIEDYYNGIYFDGEEDLILKMEEIQKAPTTLHNIKSNTRPSCAKYSKEQYAASLETIYQAAIEKNKQKQGK
ncbi:MAG: glycosyltransferase [Anaeroplasmataceae bacterium]|nr:glycosyltransferase [Anaeroplasmataceae bacterium]